MSLSTILKQPTKGDQEDVILNSDINDATLNTIYDQLADYRLQISQLDFPRIGVIMKDHMSNTWHSQCDSYLISYSALHSWPSYCSPLSPPSSYSPFPPSLPTKLPVFAPVPKLTFVMFPPLILESPFPLSPLKSWLSKPLPLRLFKTAAPGIAPLPLMLAESIFVVFLASGFLKALALGLLTSLILRLAETLFLAESVKEALLFLEPFTARLFEVFKTFLQSLLAVAPVVFVLFVPNESGGLARRCQ